MASFDLPVRGGSLAVDLARAGHRVYVMDARGYGASTRPAALSRPPESDPPAVRSAAVVRDVTAVVEAITHRARSERVALPGWATGGHWLGQYAAAHAHRVSHLVVYNSLYGPLDGLPTLGRGTGNEDPDHPGRFNAARYGAYRLSTGESLLPSWDNSIPVGDKSVWRDPASSTPTCGARSPWTPRAVRALRRASVPRPEPWRTASTSPLDGSCGMPASSPRGR
ncbi:alpha/beta fold hydrolase [Prauserella flavalba]|uniref:alpha/beta fold hydrolase n=1 Tax=Prauserella flavalba TaxID=1477506 RepID=UPI0036E56D1D